MRITVICLMFFVATTLGVAQSKQYENLEAAMQKSFGAATMTINKEMLSMIDFQLDDEDTQKLIGDIKDAKAIVVAPVKGGGLNFMNEASGCLEKGKYTEIKEDENGRPLNNSIIRVFVMRSGLKIKECHLVMSGALISFFGDFHIQDLMKLKDKAGKLTR